MTDASVELGEALGQTSSNLLVLIKSKDQEAWRRFVHLYGPLVYGWCRRFGLQEADAADVGQDVFRKVAESIEGFHHDRKGDSFRGWLRSITRSRVFDFLRQRAREAHGVGGSDAQSRLLEFPCSEDESGSSVEDDKLTLVRRAVELVLESCKEETRQAFLRIVVAGHDPADVAAELGMTANAVYVAKSRILRRLREEFSQLVDL
jgi:RNA polymerase sigma-70 factor, ECF subfamily